MKNGPPSPGTTPSRRNSWMSSISSKFSSSPNAQHAASVTAASPPVAKLQSAQESQKVSGSAPKSAPRNAVLPPGPKADGNEPYIPAPPKGNQPGFLQNALRRLSSNSGQLSGNVAKNQHGLCERKVLNVDRQRERCRVKELDSTKLRRVAFCVDVEIAGGPRYTEDDEEERSDEKKQQIKKKKTERGEGEALKHPEVIKEEKEKDGVVHATGEKLPKEPAKEGVGAVQSQTPEPNTAAESEDAVEKDTTKKKEKKKRSEDERKARKEKKRRQAEADGMIPVEVIKNSSDSLATPPSGSSTPKIQAFPTIDPARIYRRCCQLRESPILKKITEQLTSPANVDKFGVVNKLDLSSYWLQLPDLITLGDYLAVVPVKELIMEYCGLTDEGVRVILAGLLAARSPTDPPRKMHKIGEAQPSQRHKGTIERVVLKNNTKIGMQGWRHVGLFIHMSRSLKSLDMSMNPFPNPIPPHHPPHHAHLSLHLHRTHSNTASTEHLEATKEVFDMATTLSRALGERLGGSEFELLNVAETSMNTEQIGLLIDGAIKSDLRRLGLAQNNITKEGLDHVARFLQHGKCAGLDLAGNDLNDSLDVLAEALDEDNPLWALSLSNCSLDSDSLWTLFSVLSKLKNFRFIDLSHNHKLFASTSSALPLLRKYASVVFFSFYQCKLIVFRYIPRMPVLKRIHLNDVNMTAEQAIALAETLAESPSLAHVNMMENAELSKLASAHGDAEQEEACALYASLMAAVRVSKSLVYIDIDVPSPDSSEVVKAMAKQVVAYCLRNMERDPVAEISKASVTVSEAQGQEKEIALPDVLLHLVGHDEEEADETYEPAPNQDYVIGGTGVVKALGIFLNNSANDTRRPSIDRSRSGISGRSETPTGARTPKRSVPPGKAKDMSKNLLDSARKIRAGLQPALIREAQQQDNKANYREHIPCSIPKLLLIQTVRLQFLDQTLERMIKRFEDEYPETRRPAQKAAAPTLVPDHESPTEETSIVPGESAEDASVFDARLSDDEGELKPALSRRSSDVSIASRALSQEEGRMHRFGQQMRRDLLQPDMEDCAHGTTDKEQWAPHLQLLRSSLEDLGGEELRRKIEDGGQDALTQDLNMVSRCARLMEDN